METVISSDVGTRAIVRFAAKYGIKGIVLITTMKQRSKCLGDLELYAETSEVEPVLLKNVQFPTTTARKASTVLNYEFMWKQVHKETV